MRLIPLLWLCACGGLSATPTPGKGDTPTGDDDDATLGDDDDATPGDDDDTTPGDDDDTPTGDDDDTTPGDDDDDNTAVVDSDGDGVADADDLCPGEDDRLDADADTLPDACDPCPTDPGNDDDADGLCAAVDPCPLDVGNDADGDGACESVDPCPADALDDRDGDGACDSLDPCPDDPNDDTDRDGVCDSLDPCPLDLGDDVDGDGVCDSDDICPFDDPDDTDGDGICESFDLCPLDNPDDSDLDGVCDSDDLCPGEPDDLCDIDGDGFGPLDGDCCETVADCGEPARVNPAAVEAPTPLGGIAVDDDCDGLLDEVEPLCDAGLALTDTTSASAVAAIDLCDDHVLSSRYIRANGASVSPGSSTGLMDTFGPNVPAEVGDRMLVLSSGRARTTSQAGNCGTETCNTFGTGTAPAGFPQTAPGCIQGTQIYDDLGLEVQLQAPSNAVGYKFKFRFYSFEYPEWVCSEFNDQYITWVDPPPVGSINGNISFDAQNNPVSVNIAFFDVCAGCPLGTADLVGTGFDIWDDAGATGWLTTTAPVEPGSTFTIRFVLWDTGDGELDSTVLVDGFEWILEGSPGVTTTSEG